MQCGDQGILDAPYEVYIKVRVPRVDPLDDPQTIEVKAFIPNRASAEFIAGELKAKLNSAIEPPNDTVSTGEVQGDPEPSEKDKMKKHDLVLPQGAIVVEVSATRESNDGDGGQLQILR